jgi:hypothetical protein
LSTSGPSEGRSWSRFWRSDSWDGNRQAWREWGLSGAAAVVLVVFQLAFVRSAGQPLVERVAELGRVLTGLAADYGDGLALMAHLVALPVTFFIAVALGEGGLGNNRWTQETRARAAWLLRWSSRAVSVLSWFFIPVLIQHSTPLLGLIGPLGVQILCAHTAALAMTDRTTAASCGVISEALVKLNERRVALQTAEQNWPHPWPWWRRLVQSRAWLLLGEMIVLVAAAIPSLVAAGQSIRFWWGALIALGMSLLIGLLQPLIIPNLDLRLDLQPASRTPELVIGGVTVRMSELVSGGVSVVIAIPCVVLASELVNQADVWSAVAFNVWSGLPLLIALGCLLWFVGLTPRRKYFLVARRAAMDRQLERLERSQRQAQELMRAQQG